MRAIFGLGSILMVVLILGVLSASTLGSNSGAPTSTVPHGSPTSSTDSVARRATQSACDSDANAILTAVGTYDAVNLTGISAETVGSAPGDISIGDPVDLRHRDQRRTTTARRLSEQLAQRRRSVRTEPVAELARSGRDLCARVSTRGRQLRRPVLNERLQRPLSTQGRLTSSRQRREAVDHSHRCTRHPSCSHRKDRRQRRSGTRSLPR